MSFLETPTFPRRVAFGFVGGTRYNTSRAILPNRQDKRNVDQDDGLGKWVVSQRGKNEIETRELIAFKRVVKGMGHGFRFPDWSDYKCIASEGNGEVVFISGTTWQLYKSYAQGALSELRLIQKPRPGTVTILGGGSYTLNTATGTFTHNSGAAPIGWVGEFDVPAIFGDDEINIEIVGKRVADLSFIYSWGSISIEEIPL